MGTLAAFWGACGFLAILMAAIYRLSAIAAEGLSADLYWHHWLVLLSGVVFMAYFEGFRGFQTRYSPRFAARTHFLRHHVTPLRLLLAPLFCMGFFHAPKRRIISACCLTLAVIMLVVLFHRLPQPWRGLLDAGVVVGLVWGAAATAIQVVTVFSNNRSTVDPEVSNDASS